MVVSEKLTHAERLVLDDYRKSGKCEELSPSQKDYIQLLLLREWLETVTPLKKKKDVA
jgi:hypothetical protein